MRRAGSVLMLLAGWGIITGCQEPGSEQVLGPAFYNGWDWWDDAYLCDIEKDGPDCNLRSPTQAEKYAISQAMTRWARVGHVMCTVIIDKAYQLLNDPRFQVWDNLITRPIPGTDPPIDGFLNGDTHSNLSTGDSYAHLWIERLHQDNGRGAASTMFHEAVHALDALDANLSFTESEAAMLANYCVANEPNF